VVDFAEDFGASHPRELVTTVRWKPQKLVVAKPSKYCQNNPFFYLRNLLYVNHRLLRYRSKGIAPLSQLPIF